MQEFIPPSSQRLAWLTGFTGSYGFAVILQRKAALFSDGRYGLQMKKQVDQKSYGLYDITKTSPASWLKEWAMKTEKGGGKQRKKKVFLIGYDPWQFSISGFEKIEKKLADTPIDLVALKKNPVDALWEGRPKAPGAQLQAHPVEFSGETSKNKRKNLALKLKEKNIDSMFLNNPASIAWLLNIRGDDIPYMPAPLCFFILYRDGGGRLFVTQEKLIPEIEKFLGKAIKISPPEALPDTLGAMKEKRVLLDPTSTSMGVRSFLKKAELVYGDDLCTLPKSCRHPVECKNLRLAHYWDGVAMVRFLAWLEEAAQKKKNITELTAVARLQALRAEHPEYRGPSFETISAFADHGAIIHYHPTPKSDKTMKPGGLYLVDSGGQYRHATTDTTRTVLFGDTEPPERARALFTAVLKGHIALATAFFPKGTKGGQLDSFARDALWRIGMNYSHGTGHGVGSYLGVHEGPQKISASYHGAALRPGMVLSNEPGCYVEGAFGIRLENLLLVINAEKKEYQEEDFLAFENLTWIPFERRLIDKTLLTSEERAWINAYHKKTRVLLWEYLTETADKKWLEGAAAPL